MAYFQDDQREAEMIALFGLFKDAEEGRAGGGMPFWTWMGGAFRLNSKRPQMVRSPQCVILAWITFKNGRESIG